MIVTGLDGKEYKLNYTKYQHRKNNTNKSKLHKEAKELIKDYFSQYSFFEEVTLPGSKTLGSKGLLYSDFLLPEICLIIEVHGKQHYEYVPHFHGNKYNFVMAKKRDNDKIEWARINEIDLAVLPYNKKKEWKTILQTIRPLS